MSTVLFADSNSKEGLEMKEKIMRVPSEEVKEV